MRRVPSRLIFRASSSPSVNDTEAALWTIVVVRSAIRSRSLGAKPMPGSRHVGGHGLDARSMLVGAGAEQVLQHAVHPCSGSVAPVGADER